MIFPRRIVISIYQSSRILQSKLNHVRNSSDLRSVATKYQDIINSKRNSHSKNLRKELDWRNVIAHAEQIVGYPTSYLNLRWLFNDEIANTAIHLRKLVSSGHPLLKHSRNLLLGSNSNLQSVGLIILLVSKAAGFDYSRYTRDLYNSGVLHSQRAVAEIVEMKRTGHMIHSTMCNLQLADKNSDKYKDLLYGNKIALLTGDYLFATCFFKLGGLRNNDVTKLIASGLRDLVEGDYFGCHDGQPLPAKPKGADSKPYIWENENNLGKLGSNDILGQCKDEWVLRTILTSGSILGKGCQAAMKLSNQETTKEKKVYLLGVHMSLLWQLYLDIKDFYVHPLSFSLVGAPVMFALWEYPTIYGLFVEAKLENRPIQHKELYYAVKSTRAMEYLSLFLNSELEAILRFSDSFPVEDARVALQKMASTVHWETLQYIE